MTYAFSMERIIAVYIMTNKPNGTFYLGSTNDLRRRLTEHQNKIHRDCFTAQHDLTRCVYLELCPDLESALILERRYKHYKREWKIALIETLNPSWDDLADKLNTLV